MKYITEEGRNYFNEARELQLDEKISLRGLVPGLVQKMKDAAKKKKSRKEWPGLEKKKPGWWDAPVLDKEGNPRSRRSVDPRKGAPNQVPLTRKGQAIGKGLEIASDLVKGHEEPLRQGLKGINPDSTPYDPATDPKDDDDDDKPLTKKDLESFKQTTLFQGEGTPAKIKQKRQTGPRRKGEGKGDHSDQQYLPGFDPEKEDDENQGKGPPKLRLVKDKDEDK